MQFQRIARRNKKAFFNEQCKEIEENNRKEKTRDLFKKTGDIKGTFHSQMGLIKDRNGKDITAVEEIKKWQEYMSNVLMINDWDNLNSVVTHLEPDVLRWALGTQVGLRKHYYKKEKKKKKDLKEVMEFQLSYFKS